MKTVEVAFAMLVFNVCMGLVTHAALTEYPMYYESEVINQINSSMPDDVSTISESEQYTTSMNIFTVFTSVVTFDWLYMYAPEGYDEYLAPFVIGLDCIMLFFSGLALLEFFVRRADLLGSSSSSG